MEKIIFKTSKQEIPNVVKFVQNCLTKSKIDKAKIARLLLTTEDVLNIIIENSKPNSEATISVSNLFGRENIKIRAYGKKCNADQFALKQIADFDVHDTDIGDESKERISSIVYKTFAFNIKHKYVDGENIFNISDKTSKNNQIIYTLISLALGIIFGFIFALTLPESSANMLKDSVLSPLNTLFMNAIKLIVTPVVFFSIVACVSSFGSLTDIGKAGINVLKVYLLTSVIAVTIGVTLGYFIDVCDPSLKNAVSSEALEDIDANASSPTLLTTILSIIPPNIVQPFLETNMLGIMFIAFALGCCLLTMRKQADVVIKFFNQMNEIFLKITGVIVKFIPIAIFCSVSIIIMSFSVNVLMSLLGLLLLVIAGCLSMVLIYGILIFIFPRLNPIHFYRKAMLPWFTAFSVSSSAATIPVTIESCKKLGVSKKLYSFSIPLGTTINMDGSSVELAIITVALAKLFGVDLNISLIISLAVTILLLSVAAPAVPGSLLVMMIITFSQVGVPPEAISLILGINIIMDMFNTASNVTGDIAATVIAAKSCKMLNLKEYKK